MLVRQTFREAVFLRFLFRLNSNSAALRGIVNTPIRWPAGKTFAFTIFDDADFQTVQNGEPVYSFLADLGFRTTKSVWPIRGNGPPITGGDTCANDKYLKWVLDLQKQGFEIALHNATYHTSSREDTIRGFEAFYEYFGHHPYSAANHTGCRESMYWGRSRLSGMEQRIYDVLQCMRRREVFEGHVRGSPLFWGDICRTKVKYVRNFSYGAPNTLQACPFMPYHDPERPYVKYWFAASEGPAASQFNSLLSEEKQDDLARAGGACIMYTHLACGFLNSGRLNDRFALLMKRLSKMNGWFVPVHTLLDYILSRRGHHEITREERRNLERKWLWHKIVYTHGRS
jgi:hypothetical protein